MSDSPRVTIVTGASSGIGRGIAIALGERGDAVVLGARRTDALQETAELVLQAGGDAFVHELDVTEAASVEIFFAAATEAFGPPDVLVNNAGIAAVGPFETVDPAELEQELKANLLGPLLCTRRVLPAMIERRSGRVVFISSDVARHPRPGMVGYGASKAGVETAARGLSLELEGTGVLVTTVRVGPTLTDFANTWDADRIEAMMSMWPRFGIQRHFETMTPADVAAAVVFALDAPMHVDVVEVQPEPPLA
jgi:NAD(P)-dependent dehydrogenase (short-subunit alcohol dehydrogenase family)